MMQRAPGYTLLRRVDGCKVQGVTALVGPSPGSQQHPSAFIPARSSSARRKWAQWAGKPHPRRLWGESRAPGKGEGQVKAAACLTSVWAGEPARLRPVVFSP